MGEAQPVSGRPGRGFRWTGSSPTGAPVARSKRWFRRWEGRRPAPVSGGVGGTAARFLRRHLAGRPLRLRGVRFAGRRAGSAYTSNASSGPNRFFFGKNRRQAMEKPVQTSSAPAAEATAATVWPGIPYTSPVWAKRSQ